MLSIGSVSLSLVNGHYIGYGRACTMGPEQIQNTNCASYAYTAQGKISQSLFSFSPVLVLVKRNPFVLDTTDCMMFSVSVFLLYRFMKFWSDWLIDSFAINQKGCVFGGRTVLCDGLVKHVCKSSSMFFIFHLFVSSLNFESWKLIIKTQLCWVNSLLTMLLIQFKNHITPTSTLIHIIIIVITTFFTSTTSK